MFISLSLSYIYFMCQYIGKCRITAHARTSYTPPARAVYTKNLSRRRSLPVAHALMFNEPDGNGNRRSVNRPLCAVFSCLYATDGFSANMKTALKTIQNKIETLVFMVFMFFRFIYFVSLLRAAWLPRRDSITL
jgi:hypothetical protein